MSLRFLTTTGNRLHDRELEDMIRRIDALEKSGSTAAAPAAAAQTVSTSAMGVLSLKADTGGAMAGDITLAGSGAVSLGSGVGTISINVTLSTATTAHVAATGAAGSSTSVARADHAHEGVHSVNGLLGDLSIVSAGGVTVTVVGSQIRISSP